MNTRLIWILLALGLGVACLLWGHQGHRNETPRILPQSDYQGRVRQ